MTSSIDRPTAALAVILGAAGVLHFVAPKPFVGMVPKVLPRKKELVLASGVVEVAAAGLLVHPATRPTGGRLALALLAAVWPANFQMSIDAARRGKPAWFVVGTVARLPLQLPLMAIARRAARST